MKISNFKLKLVVNKERHTITTFAYDRMQTENQFWGGDPDLLDEEEMFIPFRLVFEDMLSKKNAEVFVETAPHDIKLYIGKVLDNKKTCWHEMFVGISEGLGRCKICGELLN